MLYMRILITYLFSIILFIKPAFAQDEEEAEAVKRWEGAGEFGFVLFGSAKALGVISDTTFVVAHEPYANDAQPAVKAVTVLASSSEAMVVRVDAHGFTDYAAIAWGREAEKPLHTLVAEADKRQVYSFRNYGFLRIPRKGPVTARGGWKGACVPHDRDGAMLRNGKPHQARVADGYLTFEDTGDSRQ